MCPLVFKAVSPEGIVDVGEEEEAKRVGDVPESLGPAVPGWFSEGGGLGTQT